MGKADPRPNCSSRASGAARRRRRQGRCSAVAVPASGGLAWQGEWVRHYTHQDKACENPRVPGQGDPRAVRRARAARRGGASRRRRPSASRGASAARVVVKAQIHAGGRGKGGGVKLAKYRRRGRAGRQGHARHDARHAPDRPGRARGRSACSSRRGCRSTRELYLGLVLDRAAGRPVLMVSSAGRHGDREGRRGDARADLQGVHRPGHRAAAVPGAEAGLRHRAWTGRWWPRPVKLMLAHLRGVLGDRRVAGRDQPAHRRRRAATCWRSTRR